MIPTWITLIAASKEELLGEIQNVINEMGGIEKAQEALRQLATEKTSNWVNTERFVIAKSVQDLMREFAEDSKAETAKPREEAPAKEEEEKSEESEDIKTEPQKLSQVKYLATLLGLVIGAGGVLTVDQLKKINLQREIDHVKVGDVGKELAEKPVEPPTIEISEEEYAAEQSQFKAQIKMREDEINRTTDPAKREKLERDLRMFKIKYKSMHQDEGE